MKNSGVCPKCGSTEIRADRRRTWATMVPVASTVFGAVYASRFICVACGFVETWVENEKDLEKIRTRLKPR